MRETVAKRMYLVLGALLLSFVAVTLRAYDLQIVRAEAHLARGDWRSTTTQKVRAPRGAILDRSGRELAQSVHAPTLLFDPRHFFSNETTPYASTRAEAAKAAANLDSVQVRCGAPDEEGVVIETPAAAAYCAGLVRKQFEALEEFDAARFDSWVRTPAEERSKLPQYFVLERRMPPARAEQIIANLSSHGIDAVYSTPEYRRIYPYRAMAGRTIGAIQGDGVEGLSGIERRYNPELAGGVLEYELHRDAWRRGYLLGEMPDINAKRGANVLLTLDLPLQQFVEDALAETVESFGAQAGVVIVSHVATGELRAMASWPPFDPNLANQYPAEAWLDPTVGYVFEPGSTAKIVTVAGAIEKGLVTPDTIIDCNLGSYRIGSHTVRDTHAAGAIPVWEIIQYSSNIGSLKMGLMMSAKDHYDLLKDFGFGSNTGLGLGGESAGLLRPPPWREVEHATFSYGYGFSASPLQMNMATAAIANRGRLMKPLLVREIQRPSGVDERFSPTMLHQAVSETTAEKVSLMLETVTSEAGTGTNAKVPGFRVAGKTGTAKLFNNKTGVYDNEYLASFTGFIPADRPEFAITVMILRPDKTKGYYGGVVAAPLFRQTAAQALVLANIYPEEGSGLDASLSPTAVVPVALAAADDAPAVDEGNHGDPSLGVEIGDAGQSLVPNLSGKTAAAAIEQLATAGFDVRLEGSGRVVGQDPAPGTPLGTGSFVTLRLEAQVAEVHAAP
jgi:cell division protein FtsI (penicillin-binding protein 3)